MNKLCLILPILMIGLFLMPIAANATDATAGSIETSGTTVYDQEVIKIHLYELEASKYYTVYADAVMIFNVSTNADATDIYLSYTLTRPVDDAIDLHLHPQSGSTGAELGAVLLSFEDPVQVDFLQSIVISLLPVIVIVGVLAAITGAILGASYLKRKMND